MEIKKTSKANLEKERTTFFLLGFIVALSSLFVVLEWRSEEYLSSDWEGFSSLFIEQELIESPETLSLEPEVMEEPKAVEESIEEESLETTYEDFNVVEEVSNEVEIDLDELAREELENPQAIKVEVAFVPIIQNKKKEDIVHVEADKMPQFKGGHAALARFLYNELKYPHTARNQRIQGRVWYSFTINKDGSVADIRLEQGLHFSLEEEAFRVLNLMPNWEPGTIKGEPVRVKVYLPIVFRL